MDSINSWINEDEVRQLAEDLSASPETLKKREEDNPEGFAIPEKQGETHEKEAPQNSEEDSEDVSIDDVELDEESLEEMIINDPKIAIETKEKESSSLAKASARAASAGLLGKSNHKPKEVTSDTSTTPPLCDHSINAVPAQVYENISAALPNVHPEKQIGTFEQIDRHLAESVSAKGICVIDRDGDVLYSSIKNQTLVAFTIESMMGTLLMQTQDGEFGNIRVKVAAGEYLEFVSVRSTRGVLILAVSLNHTLGITNSQYIAGDILKIANLV